MPPYIGNIYIGPSKSWLRKLDDVLFKYGARTKVETVLGDLDLILKALPSGLGPALLLKICREIEDALEEQGYTSTEVADKFIEDIVNKDELF